MTDAAPRKVLIIVENLPVPFDRRVWAEATTLVEAGYQVSVISPKLKGYSADYEEIDGVHVYRHALTEAGSSRLGYVREYWSALSGQMRLAFKVRKERGFDVIHACNPPDLIFIVAAFFKLFFGVRFIFDHHDLCPELFEAKFGSKGALHKALLALERLTFALADVSIATNDSYREIAVARGKMAPERVFVVRSGPRLDRMRIGPCDPAAKMGRRRLVGYVGVIGKQEGLDLLVGAVSHLVNHIGRKDTHFAVIGDGPELEAVKALAAAKGVSDYFTFYGRVSDETFLRVLNTSDICVNADRCCAMNDKSTMNKILEYMALAKPIVQFDLTEGRRSAGGASLYARPDNVADFAMKIDMLLGDPELRRDMGEIGRERIVNRLSWAHSAPVLLRAYAKAFEARRAAPARRRDRRQAKGAAARPALRP
ncbi:MAG TPA: glycosyltransferase family 4 protein [Parvularculaceae bacterium]|nr:glycosyltransferase family 4 protein [Parvularculaceae bacterium]